MFSVVGSVSNNKWLQTEEVIVAAQRVSGGLHNKMFVENRNSPCVQAHTHSVVEEHEQVHLSSDRISLTQACSNNNSSTNNSNKNSDGNSLPY